MPSRSEYQREREQYARNAEQQAQVKIRRMQDRMYSATLDMLAGLAVDEGSRLVFSVTNINRANRIGIQVADIQRRETVGFFGWLVRRMLRLFGLNKRYFRTISGTQETAEARALRLVMAQYGYDVRSDKLIRGGYLDELASSAEIGRQIAQLVRESLAARMGLNVFRQNFRNLFTNPNGLGILERYYGRVTFDLFQEFDRAVQMEMANETGLRYAIYAGTVKNNTRHFCRERVNRVYTLDEIRSWNRLNWAGKKPGVPVTIALGGYNCRHSLNFISQELAMRIEKRTGKEIDSYN